LVGGLKKKCLYRWLGCRRSLEAVGFTVHGCRGEEHTYVIGFTCPSWVRVLGRRDP
jgi:hypothetical protein